MTEKLNGAGPHAHAPAVAALDVTRAFAGKRLLVIGGTGFLGKIFWLMLLDRCPEVGKIFLLVRSCPPSTALRQAADAPSGGQTSAERFWGTVVHSEVFSPLRERYGDGFEAFVREKVVPIDGDLGRPLCGLDEGLVRELRGTVDAVVNVAGIVDFNPPLDEALHANAFGAQNLVALARALGEGTPRRVPLMHTSTCYVAGKRKGPIYEDDPREFPFPRSDELGKDLWDPDRE